MAKARTRKITITLGFTAEDNVLAARIGRLMRGEPEPDVERLRVRLSEARRLLSSWNDWYGGEELDEATLQWLKECE